jgi:hypothetical protein
MMHEWSEQEEKMREWFPRHNDSNLRRPHDSGTIRVHHESASQIISSWLWIVPREVRSQRHRKSSRSSCRRNAHAIQVPITRQSIATTSGGHSAILVVARRTRSQWTKNPKMSTKGTKGATRSSRMLQRLSTSSSGEMETSVLGGTKTASPGDHVHRAGGTTTTLLVRGAHLVLLR